MVRAGHLWGPALFFFEARSRLEFIGKGMNETPTRLILFLALLLLATLVEADHPTSFSTASSLNDWFFQASTGNAEEDTSGNLLEFLSGVTATGKGVIVGIIDTGIDWRHPDFRDPADNLRSRIISIWDTQFYISMEEGPPPSGFDYGREWTRDEIEAALRGERRGPPPRSGSRSRDLCRRHRCRQRQRRFPIPGNGTRCGNRRGHFWRCDHYRRSPLHLRSCAIARGPSGCCEFQRGVCPGATGKKTWKRSCASNRARGPGRRGGQRGPTAACPLRPGGDRILHGFFRRMRRFLRSGNRRRCPGEKVPVAFRIPPRPGRGLGRHGRLRGGDGLAFFE